VTRRPMVEAATRTCMGLAVVVVAVAAGAAQAGEASKSDASGLYVKKATWIETMRASRQALMQLGDKEISARIRRDFPQAMRTRARERHWWLDEIRAVADALSRAQRRKAARRSKPVGSGKLPLPQATGPISADGRLDETAWQRATSFPVGPLFAGWREGPFMLRVSVCRDAGHLYLAVRSPRDLVGLGSPADKALFRAAGRSYCIDADGELPGGVVRRFGRGHVVELAVPLPEGDKPIELSFPVELIRRIAGMTPPEMTSPWLRGEGRGASWPIWMNPIRVTLVPADVGVCLTTCVRGTASGQLSWRFRPGTAPNAAGEMPLEADGDGVMTYAWTAEWKDQRFELGGFVYVEPVMATLTAARQIVEQSASIRTASSTDADVMGRIDALAGRSKAVSPRDRAAWRAMYCQARALRARAHLSMLDAPLLFAKRHSYVGLHIYDTFFKWGPGGGIYVIEYPSAPPDQRRIRAVIDPATPETLGEGMYSDPELSWDATRLLFCFKGKSDGCTSIYEIGVDGRGLRRLTDPTPCCDDYKGSHAGVHDVSPAYLPDGRIVFTSTRLHGLVPCANEGVNILHVMNADGTGIHTISVNNVNEFDPCILPDGRILHGRWEYVDKTALTQQSLWTIFPDGTNETALFANNMVHPEALLDARPVPGLPHLVAASFTPHNSPPRGSIGIVDTCVGKNGPAAIVNYEHEDQPTHDRGNSCEPWPLSQDVILFSSRPKEANYNAIEILDRSGRREVVFADPSICCHSPMLVKPRPRPLAIPTATRPGATTGRFNVLDVYQGLTGVQRGQVKWLRVIEETSRVSATPGGAFNQTFLMSGVLAWSAKNFLGVVPVEPDGSAYFEVPSGRAVYLQAIDDEGRLIQSMRTFVQAAPGVTRSCIGCHEHKFSTPLNDGYRRAMRTDPVRLKPESWGSGFIDYPSMVQPILDKHCVRCHGGRGGVAARLDLSGGWTEYFSISYENLINRRETQVTAYLIAGIDCMNGTSRWSAQIFPPRFHGSGAAPLAEMLVAGHQGRVPNLTRRERDLILAWIDTNGLYHGTWDYTDHGCRIGTWPQTKQALTDQMEAAGCMRCHKKKDKVQFENDWFNLERPEFSRILRAPLAEGKEGWGLGLCRDRKADPDRQRVRLLATGGYIHHVLALESLKPKTVEPPDDTGKPVVSFASAADEHYQAMLAIIQRARRRALSQPRVDMPGAEIKAGAFRQLISPPLPEKPPALSARADDDGIAALSWPWSADTIGLTFEVHRGDREDFAPCPQTLLSTTTRFRHEDPDARAGRQHYALLAIANGHRSQPARAAVTVPSPARPRAPTGLEATAKPGEVVLTWDLANKANLRFNVYRAKAGSGELEKLNDEPVLDETYVDVVPAAGVTYQYVVRAISRRGLESGVSSLVAAAALPERRAPVFAVRFDRKVNARLMDDVVLKAKTHGKAKIADGTLDLRAGGHVSFPHKPEFDLASRLSVECSVYLDQAGQSPVVVSCGQWNGTGWFLQKLGGTWRWHLGGVDCDGGKPEVGRWVHVVATFDGRQARVYQDGVEVASKSCSPNPAPYTGSLLIGQYSPGPAPSYQVTGRVADVKIYRRTVRQKQAEAMFKAARPQPARN